MKSPSAIREPSLNNVEVHFDDEIDFTASLETFRRSGDDLLDRWDGEWLTRTVRLHGQPIAYAARVVRSGRNAVLSVAAEDPSRAQTIAQRVVRSFVTLPAAFAPLCQRDPVIDRLAKLHPGFRPVLHPDLLVALIRCISAQQVNLRWAATTRRRLAEKYGTPHNVAGHVVYSLDPERLAKLDPADIRALQFTTRKAEYIVHVAHAIADGALDIEHLRLFPDDDVIERIVTLRGLGVWTAEWILARTLGRPRVSASDLGVRKAVGKLYFDSRMPSPDEVREATAHWGAAAAVAQELLLHAQHLKTLAPAVTPIV